MPQLLIKELCCRCEKKFTFENFQTMIIQDFFAQFFFNNYQSISATIDPSNVLRLIFECLTNGSTTENSSNFIKIVGITQHIFRITWSGQIS